jgi:hypothetical protein
VDIQWHNYPAELNRKSKRRNAKNLDEKEPFRYSGQLFGESIARSSSLGTWNTKKGVTIAKEVNIIQ